MRLSDRTCRERDIALFYDVLRLDLVARDLYGRLAPLEPHVSDQCAESGAASYSLRDSAHRMGTRKRRRAAH